MTAYVYGATRPAVARMANRLTVLEAENQRLTVALAQVRNEYRACETDQIPCAANTPRGRYAELLAAEMEYARAQWGHEPSEVKDMRLAEAADERAGR